MNDIQVIAVKQTALDSRDVSNMIGKRHKNLLRDIQKYIRDISTGSNLSPSDFFIESNYLDDHSQVRPCYLLTKQGCEFVANKMTGSKGNLFTANYITKFNQMEQGTQELLLQEISKLNKRLDALESQKKPKYLWGSNQNKKFPNQVYNDVDRQIWSTWVKSKMRELNISYVDIANKMIELRLPRTCGRSMISLVVKGDRKGDWVVDEVTNLLRDWK